jgi:hypothetical protein
MRLRAAPLLLLVATFPGCARPVQSLSSLPFEQHTLRVQLALDRDGSAALAQYQPLVGRIGLRPILEAEGMWPSPHAGMSVQLLVNYGRYYVVTEGFRSVWEITPKPGTSGASYRPAVRLAEPGQPAPKGVRLSRYGASGASCIRIDRQEGPAVYVTAGGESHDRCP